MAMCGEKTAAAREIVPGLAAGAFPRDVVVTAEAGGGYA